MSGCGQWHRLLSLKGPHPVLLCFPLCSVSSTNPGMQGTPQRKHRKGLCVQWPRRELGAGTVTFPAGPWHLRGLSREPVKATPPPLGPEAREVPVHKQSSPRASFSFSHPAQPPERLGPSPAWPVASLLLCGYHPQPGLPARAPASPPAELLDHQKIGRASCRERVSSPV